MVLPLLRETPALAGRRVTVMGLGLFGGGLGVARFLVKAGAKVTVTDRKSEHDLRESVAELAGLPVKLRLGGHDEKDFREADLVVVNPAVPESEPMLALAPALETEMNLFFKLCPSKKTAGITGSNGKTTTTTLVGELMKQMPGRTWVGGNIGGSLLEHLDEIGPDDAVVLELSSFQLENLGAIRRSPRVAAVLNVTPNHLDRHGTMEAYAAAKRQIVAHQGPDDVKVLNLEDPISLSFRDASPSRTLGFGWDTLALPGVTVEGGGEDLVLRDGDDIYRDLFVADRWGLPGRFNELNMAAALALVYGLDPRALDHTDAFETALCRFPGVEHRLEYVGTKGGVVYYNDSKATDPEATIAAISTLDGPFVLILGGFDKKTPYDLLAREISARPVRACALMGQTADAIERALKAQPRVPELFRVGSIEEVVRSVPVRPGETVLLSPGCASWDMFRNFTERGKAFKDAVAALPETD